MSDIIKVITDLGLPVGLLIAALWYIATRTVQKSVYDDINARQNALVDAIGKLSERLSILLDRERGPR